MKGLTAIKISASITICASVFFFTGCQKEINTIDNEKAIVNTAIGIVYTDVNPDSVIYGANPAHQYSLDLNKDGITDFKFEVFFAPQARSGAECQPGPFFYVRVSPVDGSTNEIAINGNFPDVLDSLAIVDSTHRQWSADLYQILISGRYNPGCGGGISQGYWTGSDDKYLGLKIINSGKIYFGWVRLLVSISKYNFYSSISLTVRDYAYNSVPNQQILAGQKK